MAEVLKTVDSYIPGPLDGWLVGIATYFLSPPETRLRNVVAVGTIHFVVHESICDHE